ncbi:hypothetical protein [Thiomonas intermedia]|uniref:hypothetical protein n=1 Tax=Thiomonas intermedia TaxID=926 RepID=UPI0009A48AD3|nr:hypothetical protein [Thiomonas intermedia]
MNESIKRACATVAHIERGPKSMRLCIDEALRWAQHEKETDPALDRLSKHAQSLATTLDLKSDAIQSRIVIAAHQTGIDPDALVEAVRRLDWAAQMRVSNLPPVEGAQGRTPFTRFVRALDNLTARVYDLQQLPDELVAELANDLLKDSRPASDVRLLRARPYADEAGLEIGEIVPAAPVK